MSPFLCLRVRLNSFQYGGQFINNRRHNNCFIHDKIVLREIISNPLNFTELFHDRPFINHFKINKL
ncbi:hypothetical protein Sjap_005700 [Stephania japonica]|uniref:Uncharacterized protein n=1 Tax=Stephania japonica TaxID=461633 RepID=A0AAP0K4M2_9MAGN